MPGDDEPGLVEPEGVNAGSADGEPPAGAGGDVVSGGRPADRQERAEPAEVLLGPPEGSEGVFGSEAVGEEFRPADS
jgi:hypothetical protein